MFWKTTLTEAIISITLFYITPPFANEFYLITTNTYINMLSLKYTFLLLLGTLKLKPSKCCSLNIFSLWPNNSPFTWQSTQYTLDQSSVILLLHWLPLTAFIINCSLSAPTWRLLLFALNSKLMSTKPALPSLRFHLTANNNSKTQLVSLDAYPLATWNPGFLFLLVRLIPFSMIQSLPTSLLFPLAHIQNVATQNVMSSTTPSSLSLSLSLSLRWPHCPQGSWI